MWYTSGDGHTWDEGTPASKALCNSSFTLRVRNSEAPINSASYRSAGPSDDNAAAKGLKDGKRFPESENKLGLSSPAQALPCPPEEAPPEPLPDTFTWKLGLPDDDSPVKTALPGLAPLTLWVKSLSWRFSPSPRMPVPGSCPPGLSHTGLRGLLGDLLGLRPRLILSGEKQSLKTSSSLLKREKGFLSKGSRAETAPLPCENHARKMRTFFTRRLEPKTRSSYHIKWSNAKWNTLKQSFS